MAIKSKLSDKTRNELCPCESGLKQKYCHGDPKKLQVCNQIAQLYMMKLVKEERKKRGLEPYDFMCPDCKQGTDTPNKGKISNLPLCPNCEYVLQKVEKPKPETKQEKKSNIILEA
jgi:hypothetical protein